MMSSAICRRALALAAIAVLSLSHAGYSQASGTGDPSSELETRPALEAEAKRAETQHRTAEAWLLRSRLQKGDFQDGDRIIVKLLGTAALMPVLAQNDTVIVRAGKLLPLPQMADLPLEGVLRSELNDALSRHLAKYLRDSSVRAIPLIRLAVFGQVRNPGYYYSPADVLLNDLVMKAGGPLATTDMGNMSIMRGSETIWTAQDTRTALTDGLSLDRLHLRAGDEVHVDDAKGSINWTQIFSIAGPALSVVFLLYSRFH
jgi:hypothetical protein